MSDRDLTVKEARHLCGKYRTWVELRDYVIRNAYAAGLSKAEIHKLTGVARSTIDVILASVSDTDRSPAAAPPGHALRDTGRAPEPTRPPGTPAPGPATGGAA